MLEMATGPLTSRRSHETCLSLPIPHLTGSDTCPKVEDATSDAANAGAAAATDTTGTVQAAARTRVRRLGRTSVADMLGFSSERGDSRDVLDLLRTLGSRRHRSCQ